MHLHGSHGSCWSWSFTWRWHGWIWENSCVVPPISAPVSLICYWSLYFYPKVGFIKVSLGAKPAATAHPWFGSSFTAIGRWKCAASKFWGPKSIWVRWIARIASKYQNYSWNRLKHNEICRLYILFLSIFYTIHDLDTCEMIIDVVGFIDIIWVYRRSFIGIFVDMFDVRQSQFSITGWNLMKFGRQKVGFCGPQRLDEWQLDGLGNTGQSPTRSNDMK